MIDLLRFRWDQLSNRYNVDNATTQIGPIILSIMINDVYSNMNLDIGRLLFVQDGGLWKRGKNVILFEGKNKAGVRVVEKWLCSWGFRFLVENTKWMVFAREKVGEADVYI